MATSPMALKPSQSVGHLKRKISVALQKAGVPQHSYGRRNWVLLQYWTLSWVSAPQFLGNASVTMPAKVDIPGSQFLGSCLDTPRDWPAEISMGKALVKALLLGQDELIQPIPTPLNNPPFESTCLQLREKGFRKRPCQRPYKTPDRRYLFPCPLL